jgi:rhamnogalacturonan endolyase
VLYGDYTGRDTGRGMIGDVDPTVPGHETWATRLRAADGTELGAASGLGTNQSIRWAADLTTQIVNGSGNGTATIDDRIRGRLLTATDTRTNNGTKGTPSLVADVLGDWREELVVRTADSSALRVYVSTEVTDHKLTTLMHDTQYRAEVARQQTTYNQPSYTGWYLASDMDFADVPVLTAETTPPAPRLRDRPGTGKDEVQVQATDGVAWYVDGERVTAPNGKARVDGPSMSSRCPPPGIDSPLTLSGSGPPTSRTDPRRRPRRPPGCCFPCCSRAVLSVRRRGSEPRNAGNPRLEAGPVRRAG